MSHHITEVKDITFSYPDGNKAINGISFIIRHGESVGIIGANGAGKSTLLMILLGILTPIEGEVRIGEIKLTKKTLSLIRQRMGMIFQNPDDQLFMPTVYDDVAFGPRNMGLDENEVEKRVTEALKITGTYHLKERAPFKLSGGEKRSAAIATVLSMQPDILVMDEPTSALDPSARRRTINLFKNFDHTKIIASHDLDMILEICERTIVIKEGRILADGKTKDILKDKKLLESAGLELPFSMQNCPVCNTKKISPSKKNK